ncbi:hypothetical protein K3495_g3199 [Podosphaera aphanis]|nr:hypothetical protein K3495_g3199 [Podosphaera aphanis]
MRTAILRGIRTAPQPGTRCGRKLLRPRAPIARNFHMPGSLHSDPKDSSSTIASTIEKKPIEASTIKSEEEKQENDTPEEPNSRPEQPPLRRTRSGNGPKSRRLNQKNNDGLPPVSLPERFLRLNVHCQGEVSNIELVQKSKARNSSVTGESTDNLELTSKDKTSENKPLETVVYNLNQSVYKEVLTTLRAGLNLRPPKNASSQTPLRPITVLQCPKNGATLYLDQIISRVSSDLGTDLIQLDAQDIAQIVGPYLDENLAWNHSTISLYGFNAQKFAGRLEDYDDYKKSGQNEEQNAQATEGENGTNSFQPGLDEDFSKIISVFIQKPRDKSKLTAWPNDQSNSNSRNLEMDSDDRLKESQSPWNDLKANAVLTALVEAADSKRAMTRENLEEGQIEVVRPLIIQIKDYQELNSVDGGPELLQRLYKIVDKKWQKGQKILCVGTTEGIEVLYDKRSIQILQDEIINLEKRTIVLPPDHTKLQYEQFKLDEKARVKTINIRHLEDMILKLTEGSENKPAIELEKDLDIGTVTASRIEDSVWTFPRIHRIATTLFGLSCAQQSLSEPLKFDGIMLGSALDVLSHSDDVKFTWAADEMSEYHAIATKSKDYRKPLNCNTYEKKLLSGVVLPEKIRTTFSDIRAPKETIETLRTLTSLSLTRPEAFTYGILRRDRIPGVLLYGPPGTGKTLLAKAVAKESGATVLEVTAADLNNMYVGEGEKNVKALFTLAKKLSPCVIFIDEADSMFGSRETSRQRVSHREMINQFLREWDGINDFTGLIMVATNRPFDLDDAIIRRLPRRLLVDLPVEKDREEILKIHLKNEILGDSVSLTALARETPYYSGSDLKNLCVAAALTCVREENELAAKHTGDGAYKYPSVRTLHKRHFDKAIEEVSSSVSEDMSSLTAIKKFDEKYGDRKGRRAKGPGLGFGGTRSPEEALDAVRVRPVVEM